MSLDDLRVVILSIRPVLRYTLILYLLTILYALFFWFVPAIVAVPFGFWVVYGHIGCFIRWRKIFHLFEKNA